MQKKYRVDVFTFQRKLFKKCLSNFNLIKSFFFWFIFQALLPASFINGNLGFTEVAPEIQPINGLFFELVFTFILVFVIHGVCDGRRNDLKGSIPLIIGLTVTAAHLSGVSFHILINFFLVKSKIMCMSSGSSKKSIAIQRRN